MRLTALRGDVIVVRSARWQTNCTVLHGGDETFVIDSPIYPAELEALPTVLERAGWALSGLLVTHADWDHLLARQAFPDASVGIAESTALRLRTGGGDRARAELARFDDDDYVVRAAPLDWGDPQLLPVPGRVGLGSGELELHPLGGHTADGMAILSPEHRVLCCGDHLSSCEIPSIEDGGDLAAYRATLDRLTALVEGVDWVIPGHGDALDPQRALAIAREDDAYLEGLAGPDPAAAPLPLARRGPAMQRLHRSNVAHISG